MFARVRNRRVGLVVLLLPGLLTLQAWPAKAAPAKPKPRPLPVSSVPLKLPDPSIPASDGTLSVPADWAELTPERTKRSHKTTPTAGREIAERRDRTTSVFANGDGTETVRLHAGPVHFQAKGSTAWEKIDNSVVPDERAEGWLRNAANSWTVRFGPIAPGAEGGMQADGAESSVPVLPAGAKPIAPAATGNTVTYKDVWDGVDLRYTVTATGVREEIIGDDRSPGQLVFAGGRTVTGHREDVVSTSTVIGPTPACSYGTTGEAWCDGVSTGTNRWPPAQHWWLRSIAQFNYRPHVETKQLISATVRLGQASADSTPDPEIINIWDATSADFGGAVAHGDPVMWAGAEWAQGGGCYWGLDACFNVTDTVYSWQLNGIFNNHWDQGWFGFSPDETDMGPGGIMDRWSYKHYDTNQVSLDLNVNAQPSAPALTGPQDGALAISTLTPALKWSASTDGDGDALKYTAKISTSPDGESGAVATSPEGTALQWTVPAGVLRDGVTYYWKVIANDTKAWTSSAVRKLTVDRRLGAGGSSPIDTFSGVTTNLVSGNMTFSVDGPNMSTVGGGVEVDLVYNGKPALTGLKGTYRQDKDKDQVIDPEDTVLLVRTDSQVSFNWGEGSPSPAVPVDYFLANWSGTVRTPAGNWQFGLRSDDGARVWIDGTKVVDRWAGLTPDPVYQTGSVTGLHRIQFDYFEHTAPAYAELWVRNAADPAQAFVVPPDWLAPDSADLPAGWSAQASDGDAAFTRASVSEGSIALTEVDGSTLTFTKQPSGGFKPPEGVDDIVTLGGDGRVSVHDDAGLSYVFRADGGLEHITSALDDRHPAAARYTYDSLSRLSTITDPVSLREVTFRYAASDGDSACPNVPPLGTSAVYESAAGMLCRISYWDGTSTDLYYFRTTDLLSHVAEPGDIWWGFSYDDQGRMTRVADPVARDALFAGVRTDSDINRLLTEIAYTGAGLDSWVQAVTAPAALQSDTLRQQRSYTYAPVTDGGILLSGSATVTRAGVAGVALSVKYDYRAREIEKTNTLGHSSISHWDHKDLVVATESADGMLTSTLYNQRNQPTDVWGPAPKSWFDKVWYISDYYLPKPDKAALIPHTVSRYDEGLDGLDVKWWNNIGMQGPVIAHQFNDGWLREEFPPGSLPAGINADAVAGRFSGDLIFGAAGDYQLQLCVGPNDLATLYLDDRKLTEVWAVPDAKCTAPLQWPVRTFGANESHRLQIDLSDLSGDARLHLNWTRPNGVYEPIPASSLRPGYSLLTSTVNEEGKTTKTEYTDAATGVGPQHGLASRTTVDAGGLNLTGTVTYEAVGPGRFLRPMSRTLPSGSGSLTSNVYYGDTEARDNPCTTAADAANQGGQLKLDVAADPDGTGAQTGITREIVYDHAGRIVAARAGSGPLSNGDWVCTSYDSRGRVAQVKYPAYGGEPARTLTNNYQVDPDGSGPRAASPLVVSASDAAGTVVTETDLLGRGISYKDVFANTTTSGYDHAGRETNSSGPVGAIVKTFDSLDRLILMSRNGSVLANNLVYDNAGRLKSVTYPSGTGNAGNDTKGTFDFEGDYGRLKKITWTGPGGALITSDEVTRNLGGDLLGQVIDGVDHHAGNDYSYDTAGRLVEAWVPGARYQYEFFNNGFCTAPDSYKNSNRTGMAITPTGGAAVQTHYCYDHADRLNLATDAAVGTVSYDSHGNTTSIFGETHGYDMADRHVKTVKGTTSVLYVRDVTDRIVERRVNGATVARYGSTGSGDAPDFTTDASNNVQEVTFSLPGGAMLTTRAAGNVWSYPDHHGSVVAVTNQAGVKQGPTRVYDPFGKLISGTMPDNSQGDFDYGWMGQHLRPVEHQSGLQPIIEMGARQYSPLLGRFMEVDPVEGGSANDYDYCNADALNCTDLDGEWGMPKFVKKLAKKAKKFVKKAAKVVSKNMDLVTLVCKTCAIAYAAYNCARKRTVSACASAAVDVILPGISSKISRVAKFGKRAKQIGNLAKRVTKNTRFASRGASLAAKGDLIYEAVRHPRNISKFLKRYNRGESAQQWGAAYRDVRDGWQ